MPVIERSKSVYFKFLELAKNFPKSSRHTLGARVENTFIFILETLFTASYQSQDKKSLTLSVAITKIDLLKFLLELAWEAKFFPDKSYIEISEELHEIGRIVGGWKRNTDTKNSPQK